MDNLDALFQVVFFVILFVGWILKTIAEQRKQRQAPPPPRPQRPAEDDVERGPGRLEVPPPLAPPPPRPRPVPAPEGAPLEGGDLVHERPKVDALRPTTAGGFRRPVRGASRPLEVSAAMQTGLRTGRDAARQRGLRREALVRLTGGLEGAVLPRLLRAGILWREILGPPRALTGPFRSQTARRRGG